MQIYTNTSRPSGTGDPQYFTGRVRQEPIIQAPEPARLFAVMVTFEPGARTNWHTHPYGQTLHVTSGAGLVCQWEGPVTEILPGDTVWIPPGEKHWHGARPDKAMVHIAMQESEEGVPTDWLEEVTEAQYTPV